MNELYSYLTDNLQYTDAYIVIKNLLSRDPSNVELFKEFIDTSLKIATFNIVFEERKQYANEANSALALFSEKVDIDKDTLELIKETRKRINEVFIAICNEEQSHYNEQREYIHLNNNDLLNKLAEKSKQLQAVTVQEKFDTILAEVGNIEKDLDKTLFSDTQNKTYDILTKNFSQLISSKMEELNRNTLLGINKQAVACFKEVFESFSKDKGKYKNNESNLKALMTSKFFAFDTSSLFNESLIYYNHIYSMIFQEVGDDLKYKLTEWALRTTKVKK